MPNPVPPQATKWRSPSITESQDSLHSNQRDSHAATRVADGRASPACMRWSGTTTVAVPSSSSGPDSGPQLHSNFDKDARLAGSDPDTRQHATTATLDNEARSTAAEQQQQPQRQSTRPAPISSNTTAHPDPQQLQQQQQQLQVDQQTVLLGFQQCAAETLRYLTEEEGLSADDPLVRGLLTHLRAQEQRLSLTAQLLHSYDDVVRQLAAVESDEDSAFQSDDDDYDDQGDDDEEMDTDGDMSDSFYGDHGGGRVRQLDYEDSALMRSITQLASDYLWPAVTSSAVVSSSSDDQGDSLNFQLPPSSPSPSL